MSHNTVSTDNKNTDNTIAFNQYAKYKTPQALFNKIKKYFDSCDNSKDKDKQVYTITGLAYYLGFESRQSFFDMENANSNRKETTSIPECYSKQVSYIIKRARMKIESDVEHSLRKYGRSGDIFILKNFGWKDQQDINTTGTVDHNIIQLTADKQQSIEQWEKIASDQATTRDDAPQETQETIEYIPKDNE